MSKTRVILYEDLKDQTPKQQKLLKLLKIDTDPNYFLLNVHDEDINTIPYSDALIYVMGNNSLLEYINWKNYLVVGYGPSFNELQHLDKRQQLVTDLQVGLETNVFNDNEINFIDPNKLIQEKPPLKLSAVPRSQKTPKLEGHIDDAISAIQYLKIEQIPIALPELNTFISEDSTQNSLSYDELIALLLVFKRLGAEKLYWKDQVVFNKEIISD